MTVAAEGRVTRWGVRVAEGVMGATGGVEPW